MPTGKTVRPAKWSNVIDLYDDGDNSAVWGNYDGNQARRLGVRWNDGYPSQGGNPLWYVEPDFVTKAVLLELLNSVNLTPSKGSAANILTALRENHIYESKAAKEKPIARRPTFKEFLDQDSDSLGGLLLEYKQYTLIPGTRNSFREDPGNSATKTVRHSHVYAKPNGSGKCIYAVNIDGTGHDGSSNKKIPDTHANFFRSQGYNIPSNNVLEFLEPSWLNPDYYKIILG